MIIVRKHFHLLAVSTLLTAMPTGGAWAQNVDAALDRLKTLVEQQSFAIEWDSADIDGADAVLVGVRVGAEGAMAPIGDVTLTGISQVEQGYRVESIEFETFSIQESGGGLLVDEVSMSGVLLPDSDNLDLFGGFLFYENMTIGTIDVKAEGKQVLLINDINADITAPVDGKPMDFTGAVESFAIDLSIIPEADQKAVLEALGYLQLNGYMEMAGSWQPTDGRMALSQYDITVTDAGTLGMSFDLGGYTPELIASLRQLQQQMAANPGDDAAQGLAMLGLLQQMTFHSAEIYFSDDSLTGKVVEFVAQMQGMKPSDITNQAKAVLPFLLAELKNPDLTTSVTQAVSSFLDNPGTLRVTAQPAAPVPFAQIMAAGMSEPQGLIGTLGVSIASEE